MDKEFTLTIKMAQSIRFNTGLMLPTQYKFETPELERIAKRQAEIISEFNALDKELYNMNLVRV